MRGCGLMGTPDRGFPARGVPPGLPRAGRVRKVVGHMWIMLAGTALAFLVGTGLIVGAWLKPAR